MLRVSAIAVLCVTAWAADRPPAPRFTDPDRRAKLTAAFPEVTAVFENFWREHGIPGMVFGVVVDGDLALVKGFGEQNRETHARVTPDSVFRIASMTKSFTALAILQLRDEGKLSLEDPVSKWIPELASLALPTSDSAPLRIRTLLTHGSGLPEDNPWGDRQLAVSGDAMTGWLKKGLPFSTPPETSYEYSNYGFALLGRIVARCSGIPYTEYVTRHLLEPLHLRSATFDPAAIPKERKANGYAREGNRYRLLPSLPDGAFGPVGGLQISARDLARYIAFQMAAWPPRNDAETGPVRRSSLREMQHPWRPSRFQTGRAAAYGFGLGVSQTCDFRRIVSHSGGLPGFGSYMMWLPDEGVGLLVMTNLTYTSGAAAAEQALGVLRATGALRPRELPASTDLTETRDVIVRLWNGRDQALLKAVAADNLFQDRPLEVRMREIQRLRDQVGKCGAPGNVRPENWLRGGFSLACEKGLVQIYFTLAPTVPPKVQYLEFVPGPAREGAKCAP